MQWQKYTIAFFITAAIFGTAFYIASLFDAQRLADIRTTQEAISIDILSTETQFDLLGSLDCSTISENPVLSEELSSLAGRLSVAEDNLGVDNPQVVSLKKQYSLLEIKDYLLMQEIAQKCSSFKPVSLLYFYSNEGDCDACRRMGEVLTYLRQQYPGLRVYSFDYNLDLSALRTLITLRKLEDRVPVMVINNRGPIYGFRSVEEMEKLIPELNSLRAATSTAEGD
jgi:hypothetical protein